MSFKLGNTNISELYVGNSKIAQAYLGSSLVYQLPGPTDEVQIGNQIWKTKNLSIDDGQGGIYTQTVNYGQGNVVEYYYTWNAAIRVANSINGWHLPTVSEWNTLATTVGGNSIAGTKLKSTYGWQSGNGIDEYGFAVFPAGLINSGTLNNLGTIAYIWTADPMALPSLAYHFRFETGAGASSALISRSFGLSVRLVKDAT